jgi:hypothetical protein
MKKVLKVDVIEPNNGSSIEIKGYSSSSGTGTVTSVNTIDPDAEGNVSLTQDDISNGTTYVKTHNDYSDSEKEKVTYNTPVTIAYTTAIPFTRALTIITGKTLESNDTFTIVASPVEGGGAQTWLDGNGTNAPVFTNFDYQSGTYDTTAGVRNLLTMEYIGGKAIVSILNMTAV